MNRLIERLRFYLLIALAPLWRAFLPRRRVASPRRVLIIPQLTRIGDLICTTPALIALKERYPDAHLAVVVAEYAHTEELIARNPAVDEVVVLKNDEYLEFFGLARFFRRVRAGRYDIAVNLAASTMGTLIGVFGRIPRRVKITRAGRPLSEALTDWLATDAVRYREGEYLPALYVRALAPLGVAPAPLPPKEVFRSPEGERKAEAFVRSFGLSQGELLIGMSVSAGEDIKEWGVEKFAELATRLLARYRARVVLVGAPADRKKMEAVRAGIGAEPSRVALTLSFSLAELPSLLARCSLFISADTGPVHIADALRVPLIDIMGPVDPAEQAPRGSHARVIAPRGIPPTIFALRPAGDPRESRRAAEAITVGEAVQAAEELLASLRKTKNL